MIKHKKNYSLFTSILFLFIFILNYIPAHSVLAGPFKDNPILQKVIWGIYNELDATPEETFLNMLGSVIFMLLTFLGIMFILLIIYGGYIWMNARGNDSDVQRAQHIIRDATIGLVVLASSYGIWLLISQIF